MCCCVNFKSINKPPHFLRLRSDHKTNLKNCGYFRWPRSWCFCCSFSSSWQTWSPFYTLCIMISSKRFKKKLWKKKLSSFINFILTVKLLIHIFSFHFINNQRVRIAARPVNRNNAREIDILLELAVLEEVVCFSVFGDIDFVRMVIVIAVVVVTEIPNLFLLGSYSFSYNCRTSLIVIKLLNYHHF